MPGSPGETAAERLRQGLARLSAEQQSNSVFYAGPKGILGMGTRWGSWQLAEELVPADGKEIHPFRSWDVIRAVHDQLRMLERGPLHTGGFPTPYIKHWIVSPIGENAKAVARPSGTEVEAFQIRGHEIQRICNEQQFGSGNRHYLGVQFTLWDGQLVITMLITVTVLHETLRIEVTGHALGPVHSLFTTKPAPKTKTVAKPIKFWETTDRNLPLIDADEVVRLAVRAPLTWYPPLLDYLGGRLVLPEPFGLRHAWADKPWRHRFMADDALRAATPVLRVVHSAAHQGPRRERREHREVRCAVPASSAARSRTRCRGRRTCTTPESAASREPAGQASASILRVSASSCGRIFVWPTTGMKFVSPPQRGTMCWCRCAAMPAPAGALVHADVEAVRA